MRYQPIYDIAEIVAKKGITDAVLCPGSRCAPLTLAFTRHPNLTSRTFSDERSAGFIALGMAQSSGRPSVVICTSGTAVYNLAPSVAEAYLSETPMIVLSADRPSEWIAQHDGQTIYQSEIFGKHVKKFYQLPQDYDTADSVWAINRIINEAVNLSMEEPKGPVHINCPFREPLYPEPKQKTSYSNKVRVIEQISPVSSLSQEQRLYIKKELPKYRRILLVIGQSSGDPKFVTTLDKVSKERHLPVVADIISNVHGVENGIRHADLFLGQAPEAVKKTLQPDLLISFGQSLISKNVKLFLRKYHPEAHWHIQPAGMVTDPFQHITNVVRCDPAEFLNYVLECSAETAFEVQKQVNYEKLWEIEDRRTSRNLEDVDGKSEITELGVVKHLLEYLPHHSNLHLANSMSVRYANFFGLQSGKKDIQVYSNRGTSGIDGCTSTAVGHTLASDRPTFLITGDVAFFYDRNAFWHNYPIDSLRVLLLNNHGGSIFNIIDGPSSLPESTEYFVTKQKLSAKSLCAEFSIDHLTLDHPRKLKNLMKDFLEMDRRPKIMEVETDVSSNKKIFDALKQKIKNGYEL